MGQPTLSGNVQSFLITAAQGLFNGVDLGFLSGVKVNIKHQTTDAETDQLGKTKANTYYVGDQVTVEAMIDEITPSRMKEAFPYADLTGSGGNYALRFGQPIGGDFFSKAEQLIIRPTVDDTAFLGRNFLFYKAAPVGESAIEFTPSKKAQIKVSFNCYPDLTQPNGQWFGVFGDPSSGTLTPAAAGTPTYVGTGNGTMASIIVNNTFTKTETFTCTCIATSGTTSYFNVVGTVSGSVGMATTGTAFFSNSIVTANSAIAFTISQGSTHWVAGDTITVATTAASYS